MTAPDVGLDAVEDDLDLLGVGRRQRAPLPGGRAVAGVAVLQVEQQRGVAAVGPEHRLLLGRELRAEVHVAAAGPVEVFEVIDDRAVEQLAQEERRAEPAVADDEVRGRLQLLAAGLVDAVGVGHCVLEGPGEVVRWPRSLRPRGGTGSGGRPRRGRPAGATRSCTASPARGPDSGRCGRTGPGNSGGRTADAWSGLGGRRRVAGGSGGRVGTGSGRPSTAAAVPIGPRVRRRSDRQGAARVRPPVAGGAATGPWRPPPGLLVGRRRGPYAATIAGAAFRRRGRRDGVRAGGDRRCDAGPRRCRARSRSRGPSGCRCSW